MDPPTEIKPITVVLLPLPAQGHLNQLLHLARHISHRSIPVHYVGSTTHNRQARNRANGWDPTATSNLHFHDFPLPPYSTPRPNPNSPSTTKFPTHLQPAFDATLHLSSPLSSLLRSLSTACRRVVLIHDSAMAFATNIASSLSNVESYVFHSVSAFTVLFFHWQSLHHPPPPPPDNSLSAPYLSELTFEDCFSDEFLEFIRRQHEMTVKDCGRILNTCRVIEGEFIDQLALEPTWQDQKVFAIGPLNPITVGEQASHECLDWLDKQPPMSVVYVSFGTTSSLLKEQIVELASGLVSSGQRFLWVLRDADRGDIYDAAGSEREDGLEDLSLNCDRGTIFRGWVPQLEILNHRATGGFLTHCGWNSCMESMSMGVPMLTWPMHSDQPRNSVLVTEVLKVGIVARDWGKRNEVLAATAIRDSVIKLMVEEQGREVKERAKVVGEAIRHWGTFREDLNSFIAHITR